MITTLLGAVLLAPSATLKVEVEGEGYLRFARDGRAVYARSATLAIIGGRLSHESGYACLPGIAVQGAPDSIECAADGTIAATYMGQRKTLGRLNLAIFPADVRPVASGDILIAIDRPQLQFPGSSGVGKIVTPGSEGKAEIKIHAPANVDKPEPKAEKVPVPGPNAEFLKAGGVQIVLADRTEVDTPTYTLGQIATVYAKADIAPVIAGIELGQTPPVGIERTVDRARLIAQLKLIDKDPSRFQIVGPVKVLVTRKGQRVTHEQFVAAAISEAARQIPGASAMEAQSPGPDMALPAGELKLVVERVNAVGAVVTANVAAYVGGKRINSRSVKLISRSAGAHMKPGMAVEVRVVHNGASVTVKGKIQSVEPGSGSVTVVTETGAVLQGKAIDAGTVEVQA